MGKMSELSMEIQDLLEEGMDVSTVAHQLNVPTEWVVREHEAMAGESADDGQPTEYESEDDGQPTEYEEWQDLYGGDDAYDYSCEC